MLLVNMDNVPRRELNKLQISEILHGIMRMEKSSNPDKYARCMPEYSRFVSRYAFAVNGGKIKISDKNIVATVNFLEKMSGSIPCEVECVDSAVSKLKIQYANAIISGRVNVPKKDLKYVIDGFESELRRNNDDNNVITSALEKIRPLYQEMCQEDKDEFVQNPSKVFFEKQKERSEKKEQLKNLGLKERIKKKVAGVAQSCEQKIAEKIEQYKNVAQQKAQERKEKVAAKREKREAKTGVLKPLFARAMPYAASVLLLVGITFGFSQDSTHAGETDASNKDNKTKVAKQNTKNNEEKTYMVSEQDLARANGNFAVQQSEPVVKDTVVKHDQKIAPKPVVKNNANVKSSDKFYDSRLDKFFGDKKSDVLQKIQNRMQNVDLGGISAERVAYTMGVYSAYGYNIDVLNNFVNGAELNSDQIKELKSVIDLAKPHGTGVRDLAAAHITSREIHEMCACGDKSSAEKKIAQAKSNVKSSNDSITKSDVLKMVNDNIKCGKSVLNPDDSATLTKLLLQNNLGPDDCANMTKLLLLAGVDKNIVNQIVRQNNYSNTVLMPDNYVQRLEKQSGQKKPVWYSRCFRISRYSR